MKYIKILFLLVMVGFICHFTNVSAKVLSLEEVSETFNNSETIKSLEELGSKLYSEANESEQTLDIYSIDEDGNKEKTYAFNYKETYLEIDNRDVIVTEETAFSDLDDLIYIALITQVLMENSLDENKTISYDGDFKNTYEEFGMEMEIEHYSFTTTDETGESSSMSGDFIKYCKISTDLDLLQNLVDKYGVDKDDKTKTTDLVPSLGITSEKENEIELSVILKHKDSETYYFFGYDDVYCDLYRSKDNTENYEKINNEPFVCINNYIDNNLESGATYYYKAKIVDTGVFGNFVRGTTLKNEISFTTDNELTNNVENKEVEETNNEENPKTAVSLPICLLLLASLVGTTLFYIKKKTILFKNI